MSNPQVSLDIQFATPSLEKAWAEILPSKKIRSWAKAALKQDAQIVVRLVGMAESKRLNFNYRQQNHATNILTFILHESHEKSTLMADLVFCMPIIAREAEKQGKTIQDHFAHLTIHGVLHAQGFDHEDDLDAQAMESLEVAILKRLKIKDPYA
jgi:probable rRNA maturation factor